MIEEYPNTRLSINVRPVRFCYFYEKGKIEDLKKILRFVNTQWGGLYNPIIPIYGNGQTYPFYKQVLKTYPPDKFVSTLDINKNKIIKKLLERIIPDKKIGIDGFDSFAMYDTSAHPLHFLTNENKKSYALLCPKVTHKKNNELLQLILFGEIYSTQKDDYKKLLSVQEYENLNNTNHIINAQFWIEPYYSPINFTTINIKTHSLSGFFGVDSDMIDLVIGEDEQDLIYYWNLRGLREQHCFRKTNESGRKVLLLPIYILRNTDFFDKFFNNILESFETQYHSSNLNLSITHIPKEFTNYFIKQAQELGFLNKFKEEKISFSFGGSKINSIPKQLTYLFSHPVWFGAQSQIGTLKRSTVVQDLTKGGNSILYQPPLGFTSRYHSEVMIDVISDIWKSYPKNINVAESVRSNSHFSDYGLSSFCGADRNTTSMDLFLLDSWDKLKKFYEDSGYLIKPSKVTSYSSSLVDLLGSVNDLNLLANKTVLKILNILASKNSKKIAQAIKTQINHNSFDELKLLEIFNEQNVNLNLNSVPKRKSDFESHPELKGDKIILRERLKFLVIKKLINRGFFIECNQCGLKEWYPILVVEESIQCKGCNSLFNLPFEIEWYYKLNSLIDRAVDQDILTALISVGNLSKKKVTYSQYFGLELLNNHSQKVITDIDFCFIENQNVIAGECKTNDGFSKKDISNAFLLSEIGISEFYFCTLSTFGNKSNQLIEELSRKLERKGSKMKIFKLDSSELLK